MINSYENAKRVEYYYENDLTMRVFDRLKYTSNDLLLNILNKSSVSKNLYAGCLKEVEYRPMWRHNDQQIYPDILLKFDYVDCIVKVKPNDEIANQNLSQWIKELEAYFNEYEEYTNVCMIAIGGLGYHFDYEWYKNNLDSEFNGKNIDLILISWRNLYSAISYYIEYLKKISKISQYYNIIYESSLKNLFILNDIVEVLNLYGIKNLTFMNSSNILKSHLYTSDSSLDFFSMFK